MIRSLLVILCFSFAAPMPVFAQEASVDSSTSTSVEAPKFAVGDWWIRTLPSGSWYKETVTVVREDGSYETESGNEKYKKAYGSDGNIVQGYMAGGAIVEFSPHDNYLSYPIFPGKKWEGVASVHSSAFSYGSYQKRMRAVASPRWEEIILHLTRGKNKGEKKMKALRIEYEYNEGLGVIQGVCWYAPEAKISVKCDYPPGSTLKPFEVTGFHVRSPAASEKKALSE